MMIVDELLLHSRFKDLTALLQSLQAIAEEKKKDPQAPLIDPQAIQDQLSSDHRLKPIEAYLSHSHNRTQLGELAHYLVLLPKRAAPRLLDLAFQVPKGLLRRELLEVLAPLLKDQEFIFQERLEKLGNDDLPDLIALFARLDLSKVLGHLIALARDCPGKIRAAALSALLTSQDPQVRQLMLENLHALDEAEETQEIAIRYFVQHQDIAAARELIQFTKDPNFGSHTPAEQTHIFMMIGEIGQSSTLPFFEGLLTAEAGGFFGKKSWEERKLCALAGLAKVNHPRIIDLLQKEMGSGKNTPKIQSRCRNLLQNLSSAKKSNPGEKA
jgi:hypothetical protein